MLPTKLVDFIPEEYWTKLRQRMFALDRSTLHLEPIAVDFLLSRLRERALWSFLSHVRRGKISDPFEEVRKEAVDFIGREPVLATRTRRFIDVGTGLMSLREDAYREGITPRLARAEFFRARIALTYAGSNSRNLYPSFVLWLAQVRQFE